MGSCDFSMVALKEAMELSVPIVGLVGGHLNYTGYVSYPVFGNSLAISTRLFFYKSCLVSWFEGYMKDLINMFTVRQYIKLGLSKKRFKRGGLRSARSRSSNLLFSLLLKEKRRFKRPVELVKEGIA